MKKPPEVRSQHDPGILLRSLALAGVLVLFPTAPAAAAEGDCSQPLTTGEAPTARDCLYILRVSIDAETCDPTCLCSPDGGLTVTTSDGLLCLRAAVGQPVDLACACGNFFAGMGEPLPSATPDQLATFARGREVARRRFDVDSGLGPLFNLVSCAGCHEKPVTGGGASRYRDFLLVREVDTNGMSTSTGVNGVQPIYRVDSLVRQPTDPQTNLEAGRSAIAMFGVGLLAEIPEAAIIANADPGDIDGDGISGRLNYEGTSLGRFGLKAQTASLEGFVRGPLFNHLGITTDPLSPEKRAQLPVPTASLVPVTRDQGLVDLLAWLSSPLVSEAQAQASSDDEPTVDFDDVEDPELGEDDLFDLVSFAQLLAAPLPDPPTPQSEAGRLVFADIGCAGCHLPALVGPRGPVPAWSDLLLHDMGEDLADGIVMGEATGSEFRTQPLWGVAATAPYLHDGRADTLDDAIRLHGGEAAGARDAYAALSGDEQSDLLAFLDSLGGSSVRSEGLLPPGAPIPPPGELGGPAMPLSPTEEELFRRGRAVFDRDIPRAEGLGRLLNGDACRACHFDPVIGGSGPLDVNVVRHGTFDEGEFLAPVDGSIAERVSIDHVRAPVDPDANVFEARQTPPLFGLGFLESIPEAAILANDDCSNPDPAAISGCARFTDDGRLGRLGWKADVPSLAEFSRDAMSAEQGITVPEVPELTFGFLADDDDVADPEISAEDLDALTFFVASLAPPRGTSTDAVAESAGRELFESSGCTGCHVTDFVTPDGITAYTDLLLHQMTPEGQAGVAGGIAGPGEFRTPPLWGLPATAPYMHDGASATVEAAIRRHGGEGEAASDAFVALTAEQQADLLAFLASL